MKEQNIKSVRPFSGISLIFVAIIAALVYGAVRALLEISNGEQFVLAVAVSLLLLLAAVILGFFLLPFIFSQKAELKNEEIEIRYVTRTPGGLSFPVRHKKEFSVSDIAMFGVYYADDIMHCKRAGNGFLHEQWIFNFTGGVPIAIKLPDIVSCKQDMFLVVNKDGTATAIELKTYSEDQIKLLLQLFENATRIKSSGRISSERLTLKTKITNFCFGTFFILCLGIWYYLMLLDRLIVPSHGFSYQSGWKNGYVVFSMIWSFTGIAVEALRRMEKDEKYKEYKKMIMPTYFISLVAWIVSFILNIFF